MNTYNMIGLMSGSSLDGLDIAYVTFTKGQNWKHVLHHTKHVPYDQVLQEKLLHAQQLNALDSHLLDQKLGEWMGEQVKTFINENQITPEAIAVHGHTLFHAPNAKISVQIGSPFAIAATCNLPVIAHFRSGDVQRGGQGAPLVPAGELALFFDYDFCLNLGGIANITSVDQRNCVAFDICVANQVLNYLAEQKGLPYDAEGQLAASGQIHAELLQKLNDLSFFELNPPKSLDRSWTNSTLLPIIDSYSISIEDKLRTFVQHIVDQIFKAVMAFLVRKSGKMLVTGGGAYNTFLMEQLSSKLAPNVNVEIPNEELVEFKEALIFAFLGALRLRNEPNCLASVTGASQDHVGGIIFH